MGHGTSGTFGAVAKYSPAARPGFGLACYTCTRVIGPKRLSRDATNLVPFSCLRFARLLLASLTACFGSRSTYCNRTQCARRSLSSDAQEEQAAAADTAKGAGQGAEEAHVDEQLRRRCGQGHIRAREDCGAAHCEGRHDIAANRAAAPTSAAATAAANAQVDKEIGLTEPPKKQRNVSLSGLLGAKMKKRTRRSSSTSWRSTSPTRTCR